MGFDQANKPPVHKDPDRGGGTHASHMCIRDDVRARRYPGMVPVVEAVTMGVQAAVLLAPGCLGPGWSPVWRLVVVPGQCLALGLCLMG